MNEVNEASPANAESGLERFVMFLNSLPDIAEYRYMEGDKHVITQEWLCGTFAGRAFIGSTELEAVSKMKKYLDGHIGHESMVGGVVTRSGWPDLDKVKVYIADNHRSANEET